MDFNFIMDFLIKRGSAYFNGVNRKDPIWGEYKKSRVTELDIKKSLSDGVVDSKQKRIRPLYFHDSVDDNSVLRLMMDLRYLTEDMESELPKNEDGTYKPIWIYINSCGGNLMSGFNAMDEIANISKKFPIYTLIDGKAASAATLMSISGAKRYMKNNSFMLIHELSSGMMGKYSDMSETMQNMTMFMGKIKDAYKKYTHVPPDALDEILKHDIWWDSKTALDYGLVDEIVE